MADPEIIAQFNQLKGLILQVKKSVAGGDEALPTVDFACDMFDRSDRPILDGYWSENRTAWTIRSGALVQQSDAGYGSKTYSFVSATASLSGTNGITTFSSTTESRETTSTTYYPSTGTLNQILDGLIYLARMSGPDLICKITFTLAGPDEASFSSEESREFRSGNSIFFNSYEKNTKTVYAIAQPYGMCFSDDSKRLFGLTGWASWSPPLSMSGVVSTFSGGAFNGVGQSLVSVSDSHAVPGTSVSGAWAALSYITDRAGTLALLHTTTEVSSIENYPSETRSIAGGTWSFTGSTQKQTPVVTPPVNQFTFGHNTLYCAAIGLEYSFSVNGVAYSTQNTAIMPGRNRVGIFYFLMNQLSALTQYGVGISGITSFKVWSAGMPEPPDETGHGVYSGNAVLYTDKYHDSAGNYNPEA